MKHYFSLFILLSLFLQPVMAQNGLKKQIGDTLNVIANRQIVVGNVAVRNLSINKKAKKITVTANENLGSLPFRDENVEEIYGAIRFFLPKEYKRYKIFCKINQVNIEDLIPNYYRNGKTDEKKRFKNKNTEIPLLKNISRPNDITKGLQNRHLALWQSHGWHYDQGLARWEWQRARLHQTVEDLYTQSYVLPFLVPMLENAGANVLLPRERDTQVNEVIVDNNSAGSNSEYKEINAARNWENGQEKGFADTKKYYLFGENPFALGTYRQCETTANEDESSKAWWIPDIPESGKYAVYVSYKTLPNSVENAKYTVYHKGGTTQFEVNQTMYGGTWLYLGHFDFQKGISDSGKVVLSNYSRNKDKMLTADAVKFGGGMGNMARQPMRTDTVKYLKNKTLHDSIIVSPAPDYVPEISAYPRFAEGARYWLQWAGMPDSIYSRSKNTNDYTDDFQSRGFWVNYISGGSSAAPEEKGLNVPLDLSLAFHTDAGTTANDSIIGTLAICTTQNTDKKHVYKNGISRLAARDLTDIVQTQIVSDIRLIHAPEWVRRGIWDKSYSESRVPEVPGMLLELLSHQNFADMRYGLDPRFRFTVSRSIYKGILRYFESVYEKKYIVQPLPVEQFSIHFVSENEVELNWQPVNDPLEPSAEADQYIVYTKTGGNGFDNGCLVDENRLRIKIDKDKIYSFKVSAVNAGGESFPSETLSVCRTTQNKGEILIVNGFDRISAPASFAIDSVYAGFINAEDAGVPYLADISFIGEQYEFRRDVPWSDDDAPGFGASRGTYETTVVAGNTFDYPALHGKSMKEAGYSFVSCSKKAFVNGKINAKDFKIIDLILGKQRETYIGNRQSAPEFKTFPLDLQKKIEEFTQKGGNLFVSGSNIASDMYHNSDTTGNDIAFVETVLKCKLRDAHASAGGKIKVVQSSAAMFEKGNFFYYDEPNPVSYFVEAPDAIEPIDNKGHTILRYGENNLSAGIVYNTGKNKICAFGFPFETIKEESERNELMAGILLFFN